MRPSCAFDGIGTHWQLDSAVPLAEDLIAAVHARVAAFDASYSRFRDDSGVARLARGPGSYQFGDDAVELFTLYRRFYDCTGGRLTPLVGGALEHLGYDGDYRLQRRAGQVVVPDWDAVLSVAGSQLRTTAPLVLDVGAIGKGYLVDLIAAMLGEAGHESFVIDASGDLIHRGAGQERIGLQSPFHSGQVIGIANLANGALCASAVTRRRWGDGLHHIIDPATAEPVGGVLASWAMHPRCAVADGLATALFLVEPEQLAIEFEFSYVRVLADGRAQYSANFDGEIF